MTAPPKVSQEQAHWVFAAAGLMRGFASRMPMGAGHPHLDRGHVFWMLDQIRDAGMSATKACRWLGWVQAAVCASRVATLDEIKDINRIASDAHPAPQETQASPLSTTGAPPVPDASSENALAESYRRLLVSALCQGRSCLTPELVGQIEDATFGLPSLHVCRSSQLPTGERNG